MRKLGRLIAAFVAFFSVAGVVSAHQIQSSRFAAPIPLSFLFAGSGAVVGVTAVISARTITDRIGTTRQGRSLIRPSFASILRLVTRLAVLAVFGVLVLQGLFGVQVRAENLATTVVWPVWFAGLSLLVVLVGNPWRVLSPWRTVYAGLTVIEGDDIAIFGGYPDRLGVWPGVAGFIVLIGITENLTVIPLYPNDTAVLLVGYMIVMLVGGIAFGPTWFENADPLSVLYRLFERVAPVSVRRTATGGYTMRVRAPWRGCAKAVASRSAVWFVITTVYTVSFDGFTSTPEYQTIVFGTSRWLSIASGPTSILLYFVGLAVFLVSFATVIRLVEYMGTEKDRWGTLMRAFAPSVLPIAVAYEFAHYYTYVIRNFGASLGLIWGALAGDTLQLQLLGWLSVKLFWGTEVIFIVIGHVIAVVAAHYVSLEMYSDPKTAWRAHLPLVALMIGYTILSLWIISRPVVG